MRVTLLKLLFRELLIYTLPVSIFLSFVFLQTGSGGLPLITKGINWIVLLVYLWFFKKSYAYFIWNAGISLRRLILVAFAIDFSVLCIIIFLFNG